MRSFNHKFKTGVIAFAAATLLLSACNKEPEQFTETPVTVSGATLGETLAATATDSLFNRLVIRSGMQAVLNNKSAYYTLFVPNNDAVIASFGGSLATANFTVANLPVASAAGIVKYNMIPQSKLTSSMIVHGFPNMQMPVDIILDPTNPLVRMTSFPSKSGAAGTTYYYNNAPITSADAAVANGVIHHTAFVVAPPTRLLKDTIGRVSTLSYYRAALVRADSGQVGLNRFDSLLNYAVTNMTVLAPNDAAFQQLIYGLVYSQVFAATGSAAIADAQANGAVALGPTIFSVPAFFSSLSAANIRGILAYHLLSGTNAAGAYQPNIRVFANNVPSTPKFITTMVNAAFAAHPGVMAQTTYSGPLAAGISFKGMGTFPPGGAPFSGAAANAVGVQRLAVNGVFYVIDRVLLPQ